MEKTLASHHQFRFNYNHPLSSYPQLLMLLSLFFILIQIWPVNTQSLLFFLCSFCTLNRVIPESTRRRRKKARRQSHLHPTNEFKHQLCMQFRLIETWKLILISIMPFNSQATHTHTHFQCIKSARKRITICSQTKTKNPDCVFSICVARETESVFSFFCQSSIWFQISTSMKDVPTHVQNWKMNCLSVQNWQRQTATQSWWWSDTTCCDNFVVVEESNLAWWQVKHSRR